MLEMDDIQGDILEGLQKNAEMFLFYKITNTAAFRQLIKERGIGRITNVRRVRDQDLIIKRHQTLRTGWRESFSGLNMGFTKDGLTQLIGAGRPKLDPAFERGADHPETIRTLHDPPKLDWLQNFTSDRIDGILLVTGADLSSVTFQSNELLSPLSGSIKVVYSEIGYTRPGAARGHEHFGFLDGVSQPGIRGLTPVFDTRGRPRSGTAGAGSGVARGVRVRLSGPAPRRSA